MGEAEREEPSLRKADGSRVITSPEISMDGGI